MKPRPDRHDDAERRHEQSAERHEQSVEYWEGRGDAARAALARRHVDHERNGAQLEKDIARHEREQPLSDESR